MPEPGSPSFIELPVINRARNGIGMRQQSADSFPAVNSRG
jgi:hypothetical protein